MATTKSKQKTTYILIALGIAGVGICMAALCVMWVLDAFIPPDLATVDEYMNEYGGEPEIYDEILSMTDCALLQAEYNQRDAYTQQFQLASTDEYRWSLGYMHAAGYRMKAIGCNT